MSRMGDLVALLSDAVRALGFDCVTMAHHVDHGRMEGAAVAYSDYPEAYLYQALSRRYFADDPVLIACQRTAAPFVWSEVPNLVTLNSRHREILEAAAASGLDQGFTVPINVPGEPLGSCSFGVRFGRKLPEEGSQAAVWVGLFAFENARRILGIAQRRPERPALSPRQLDCVVLVGRGKSDWAIAQLLGISRDTVHEYVEAAKLRHGVATRQQLIASCLAEGQLAYADVLG